MATNPTPDDWQSFSICSAHQVRDPDCLLCNPLPRCEHGKTIAELCYECAYDAQAKSRRRRRDRIERMAAQILADRLMPPASATAQLAEERREE